MWKRWCGIRGRVAEGGTEIGEGYRAGISLGLVRVAGEQRAQAAARFSQDGRKNALAGDVADTDDEPVEHCSSKTHQGLKTHISMSRVRA